MGLPWKLLSRRASSPVPSPGCVTAPQGAILPSEDAIERMSLTELKNLIDPEGRTFPETVTVGFLAAIYRRFRRRGARAGRPCKFNECCGKRADSIGTREGPRHASAWFAGSIRVFLQSLSCRIYSVGNRSKPTTLAISRCPRRGRAR